MSNDEINRYIHVEVLGKRESKPEICPICNVIHDDARQRFEDAGGSYPDYCSDNAPRRLLNEVVEKVVDTMGTPFPYNEALAEQTRNVPRRATAEQIATACVEAHKALKTDSVVNT